MIDYIGPNTKFIGTVDKRSEHSTIKIGGGCFINGHLVLERSKSEINVGDGCSVGNNTIIDCAESIIIENNVMISYDCLIIDNDSHSIYPEYRKEDVQNYLDGHKHDWTSTKKASIIIKKGAWIGAKSIITKGVIIGLGSVVGAGSVVTKNVPDNVLVGGNPARVIKEIP